VLAAGPAALWLGGVTTVGDRDAVSAVVAAAPEVPQAPLPDPVAAPAVATPAAPAPPVRVRVPDAGVDAPVVDSGVDVRGGMAVPENIRTVGWYRFGAGPGASAGAAVLAGHVDDRIQGLGAFHRLGDLTVGSAVQVVLADGTTVGYRVGTVERVSKASLPVDRLFARDGAPRLVLVTCGGVFDRAAGGYTDNVVVTAEPEAGS
jgi:LPXTG-site transpeptidase (sortase) family protein